MTKEQSGYLIIADISGYTQFIKIHNMRKAPIFGKKMAQKWESHAEHIITELLETVIEAFDGTLILNKLEGDAAFFFAVEDGSAQQANRILECMHAAMRAFSQKIGGYCHYSKLSLWSLSTIQKPQAKNIRP